MHYRHFQAVASCALAIAFASATTVINAAQWTSFSVGAISSPGDAYGICLARLPDGRFVLGDEGSLYVQDTWGTAAKTQIDKNGILFDPSFVAIKDASSGLLGEGGYVGSSGLHKFDPSATGTPVVSAALASLQNYSGFYWKHPTSGREGWIIGGSNASGGKHNLSFVSADGTKVGAITGPLSTYSSGSCTDTAGNVYASLSEYFTSAEAADSDKVLKFTASQIDAAVEAVISGSPVPVQRASSTLVHQFDGASSIAVDSQSRVWAAGYLGHIQVYDPSSGLTRNVIPDHAPIKNAAGVIAYQVQAFTHESVAYMGFLANDSYGSTGTSLVQGYKPVSEVDTSKGVFFAETAMTKTEADGTVTVAVNISPTPTVKVTVPLIVTGTAAKGKDFTIAQTSVVFDPKDLSQSPDTRNVTVKIVNNLVDDVIDSKSVVIKLGAPTPAAQGYFVAAIGDSFTLNITDDDHKPVIAASQNFINGKIGTGYSYQIQATGATKYTVSGLPKGMTFNAATGLISGRPTVPGEYDQIWITATNAAGVSTSTGYYLKVDDFSPAAHGAFVGLVDRIGGSTSGLGGRLDLNVTKAATFTGKVTVGSVPFALSGSLDTSTTNPTGGAQFTRNSIQYDVSFTINAGTGAVVGSIVPHVTSQVGVSATGISGWPAQTFSPLAGLHNVLAAIPGGPDAGDPYGDTFGSITVQANGAASATFHAADGAVFTTSAPTGPNGEVLLYQTAYAVPGSLIGKLAIANDTPHTVTGSLSWTRPVQATGGWPAEIPLSVQGGKYRPVSGAAIVMNLPAAAGNNAQLKFDGGGLASQVHVSFRISSPAVVTIPAPYKLTVTNSTGAFTGSFKSGATVVPFQGIILPTTATPDPFDGKGIGYFLMPGTGSVVIRSGSVSLDTVL